MDVGRLRYDVLLYQATGSRRKTLRKRLVQPAMWVIKTV